MATSRKKPAPAPAKKKAAKKKTKAKTITQDADELIRLSGVVTQAAQAFEAKVKAKGEKTPLSSGDFEDVHRASQALGSIPRTIAAPVVSGTPSPV